MQPAKSRHSSEAYVIPAVGGGVVVRNKSLYLIETIEICYGKPKDQEKYYLLLKLITILP